jgi:serine/threonine-protein kinase HipA
MMTSKKEYEEAYVWIWLPEETEPVVAGKLVKRGSVLLFNYGQSYLARDNAMAIYEPELPLKAGLAEALLGGRIMPGCIRDSSPDAWGRRVIMNRKFGVKGSGADMDQLDELTYLLESGSDRIGALDFQLSPTEYVPRSASNATLEELMQSAERVEQGIPLTPELDAALHHGSSIGGARPKALIEDGSKKYIAKFSSATDIYSVVKVEFIAMRLAAMSGLTVAPVKLVKASGKDVLLIERFDRIHTERGWQRKLMVSGLTLLGLDSLAARYASYEDLAEIIRHRFADPHNTLRELFNRIIFNILCGNTDDHARNHAAFWDGREHKLTPAYDICPQGRTGNEATQAMLISGSNRMSKISSCVEASRHFLISQPDTRVIAQQQRHFIENHWDEVCDEAELTQVERNLFWQRQFLNPSIFE